MVAIDLRSWWQNHYHSEFFDYVDDFSNVLNRSSTSQSCHKYISSPTSISNIDVAVIRTFSFAESCCRVILKSDVVFSLQNGLKSAFKKTVSGSKVTDCIKSEMNGLFEQSRTLNAVVSKISPIWSKCQISDSVKSRHFFSEIKSWLDKRFIKLSD